MTTKERTDSLSDTTESLESDLKASEHELEQIAIETPGSEEHRDASMEECTYELATPSEIDGTEKGDADQLAAEPSLGSNLEKSEPLTECADDNEESLCEIEDLPKSEDSKEDEETLRKKPQARLPSAEKKSKDDIARALAAEHFYINYGSLDYSSDSDTEEDYPCETDEDSGDDGSEIECLATMHLRSDSFDHMKALCGKMVKNIMARASRDDGTEFEGVKAKRVAEIMQQMGNLNEDLNEIFNTQVPFLKRITRVKNLSTLISHLTAKGDVTVNVEQLWKQINAPRVMSYYNGFVSYRKEDIKALEAYKAYLKRYLKTAERIAELNLVFCEETQPLAETQDVWKTVEMTRAELEMWNKGLKELGSYTVTLVSDLKLIKRNLDEYFACHRNIQRAIRRNLSEFLNSNINNMFIESSGN